MLEYGEEEAIPLVPCETCVMGMVDHWGYAGT